MSKTRFKLDSRIKTLIENCATTNHRGLFAIVGEKGVNQVPILHHVQMKVKPQGDLDVLWAYKKELAFERFTGKSKTAKRQAKKQRKVAAGVKDSNEDDPFENFLRQTKFRWCYYHETDKILGKTYGMCVIQDFEAITPNTLARVIETVVGGGLIILLLQSITSIRQLCTMAMDVHSRYRTETHQDVIGRFNERFALSLAKCSNCLVIDDQLNVLPFSSTSVSIAPVPPKSEANWLTEDQLQLKRLKKDLMDDKATQLAGCLVNCCLTLDQAKGVLTFIDAILDKSLSSTVMMNAARGRGKSAALGLAMAAAVAFGYSNIFVTSPSPENLTTLFEFICKGLTALKYEEHTEYEKVISAKADHNKATVMINVFKGHRQTIKYVEPNRSAELAQAELVCIDEAAAIPMPLHQQFMGPYLVFMSSTVDGYEGTGQLLSQKLLKNLRHESKVGDKLDVQKLQETLRAGRKAGPPLLSGRTLYEVTLTESIRYANGDPVESWLCNLLCLNISEIPRVSLGCPAPSRCELFYVNRDTLFSFNDKSEDFLRRIVSICVASEYKHSPDDLQMLSDAPDHHLFCLLSPDMRRGQMPEILCVVQVSLEGKISKESIANSLRKGIRSGGDLIPWTIEDQFGERNFASKSGARIVRIATHPAFQGMGYGTRCLQLLQQYYEGKMPCVMEDAAAEMPNNDIGSDDGVKLQKIPMTLLLRLSHRQPEPLDYIGVNYGISAELLRFWKRFRMTPVYVDPSANEVTGDHSCIMLKIINEDEEEEEEDMEGVEQDGEKTDPKDKEDDWLTGLWLDFQRRFIELLPSNFRHWSSSLAFALLDQQHMKPAEARLMTKEQLNWEFTPYDISRLTKYTETRADYLLIKDLIPRLSRIYFFGHLITTFKLTPSAVLVGIGLQGKTPSDLVKERDLIKDLAVTSESIEKNEMIRILDFFNQTITSLLKCLLDIQSGQATENEEDASDQNNDSLKPSPANELHDGLSLARREFHIEADDEVLKKALTSGATFSVPIKTQPLKRKMMSEEVSYERKDKKKFKRQKKH